MKKWIVSELDKNKVRELVKNYGLPVFTSMLLVIRKICEKEQIEKFFSEQNELSDPFLIKDMDKAVKRIKAAVTSYEKICVYGDYDCDGVTSTAILYSYLESVFANVMYYIPDRNSEGYGINKSAIDRLNNENVSLIITVDNGISAIDEIDYAASLGIDVVVTDHHKPRDILPKAVAVVNPHRVDDDSPFKDFSGAGLALKLAVALEGDGFSVMENYSDLAALGTVADLVPLNGENRDIVKAGIFNMENTERVGISCLVEHSGISKINAGTLGFNLAPRINASGRLGTPYDALRLFMTEDEEIAEENAELLSRLNSQRQTIEADIYNQIISKFEAEPQLTYDRVLVVSSKGWNSGVVGIVSSRITERYGKPSIIISEDGEVCKASGRSISGFSLIDAVFACSEYLEKFGGHPMAVGFSIKKQNIDIFRRAINNYANAIDKMPLAAVRLDCNMNPEAIVTDMVYQLRRFEPFGYGNPKPIFGLNNMRLDRIISLSNGKHIKLAVSRGKSRLNILKFSTSPNEFPYKEGDVLDFAVNIDINVYQGKESISFNAREIKLSNFDNEKAMYEMQDYEKYRSGVLPNNFNDGFYPTRNEFVAVYVYLKRNPEPIYTVDSLIAKICHTSVGAFKLLIILDVLKELYLIDYSRDADCLKIKICDVNGKVDLNASRIYRKLKEDITNAR